MPKPRLSVLHLRSHFCGVFIFEADVKRLFGALRQYGLMSMHGALALLKSQGALCIEIENEDERMYDEEATPKHNLGHSHEPLEW